MTMVCSSGDCSNRGFPEKGPSSMSHMPEIGTENIKEHCRTLNTNQSVSA